MRASKILLTFTLGAMLMPSLALAEHGQDDTTARIATRSPEPSRSASPTRSPEVKHPKVESTAFCTKFTDATGQVSDDTTSRFNDLQSKFAQRGQKVDSDFKAVNDKLTTTRGDWDKKQTDSFAKLEAKATTDDQKAAVTAFEAAVKAAVTKRRAAVDAANTTFKTGVQAAVSGRQAQFKTAAATYKQAVAAALAAAKASCAAGVSPDTVRKNLQSALKTAKTNLETARKNAEKVGPNLDTLKAARKAAVDKANADYKVAIKAALATLKTALGAASPSSSPSPSPSSSASPSGSPEPSPAG
jgi:hypothetical protein